MPDMAWQQVGLAIAGLQARACDATKGPPNWLVGVSLPLMVAENAIFMLPRLVFKCMKQVAHLQILQGAQACISRGNGSPSILGENLVAVQSSDRAVC